MSQREPVLCSYCLHVSEAAVKQCLACDVYLCRKHLRVHSRSTTHTMIDVAASPTVRKCPRHRLEFSSFCFSCKACMCRCCNKLDHEYHFMLKINDAFEYKKSRLEQLIMTLTTKKHQIPNQIQQLESAKEGLNRKISYITSLVNVEDPLTVLQEQESDRSDYCDMEEVDSERRIKELLNENLQMVGKYQMAILVAICSIVFVFFVVQKHVGF